MNDELKDFEDVDLESYKKEISLIDIGRTEERHKEEVRFYIELYKIMGMDYSGLVGELNA